MRRYVVPNTKNIRTPLQWSNFNHKFNLLPTGWIGTVGAMTFISVGEGILHSKSFIQAPYATSIMILVIRYTHCVYMSRAVVHFPSTLKTTDFIITQKSDHEFVSWYVLTDVHTSYIWSTMSQLTASLVKPPAMCCVGNPLWNAKNLRGYSVLRTDNIKDKWPADMLINPDIPVYPGLTDKRQNRTLCKSSLTLTSLCSMSATLSTWWPGCRWSVIMHSLQISIWHVLQKYFMGCSSPWRLHVIGLCMAMPSPFVMSSNETTCKKKIW